MTALNAFQLIVGIDSEYVAAEKKTTDETENLSKAKAKPKINKVVSYQFSLLNPRTGQRASDIIFPSGHEHAHRLSLAACLGRALFAAERQGFVDTPDGRLPPKIRIALVAHFSRADLPSFRGFQRLKRCFQLFRGTYATTDRPAILDVPLPDGRRRRVSVTLFDTKLIAPEGFGSLKRLGEILGYPKLTLPEVVNEKGESVEAITRMDLCKEQHPAEFRAYAVRDSEIAVEWLQRYARFAEDWGLSKLPPTLASAGVSKLRSFAEPHLPQILGKTVNKTGRLGSEFLPEATDIRTPAAEAFHGGRNESFISGLHRALSPDRAFADWDIRGAYTVGMSPFRAIDWVGVYRTTDITALATLEHPTIACVDFTFPPDTKFPCLPVTAGKQGLIFPLSGTSTTIGPELLVALNMGAKLIVRVGIVLPWLDADPASAERPFIEFARVINATRKRYPKGSCEEQMAKTAGNSVYGKAAQSVGNMKSNPANATVFDSRDGRDKPLPPSPITCPILAAYASGTVRALLSEILSRLPDHVRVISCTTDGWLSDCTEAEACHAASGPVGRYFAQFRGLVDPDRSSEILEIKHRAMIVLSSRTRHAVTVELAQPQGDRIDNAWMTAKGGHHIEAPLDPGNDPSKFSAGEVEAVILLDLWRRRTFDTVLLRRDFISPRDQWKQDADLTDSPRESRVSLDYDFYRQPLEPLEIDGALLIETRPWPDIEAFHTARREFKAWREGTRSILMSMDDWRRWRQWQGSAAFRVSGRRTPYQQALCICWARGLPGFPVHIGNAPNSADPTLADIAAILTAAGVPDITRGVLVRMRRNGMEPSASIEVLTTTDIETRRLLEPHLSLEALDFVLSKGPKMAQTSEPANDVNLLTKQMPRSVVPAELGFQQSTEFKDLSPYNMKSDFTRANSAWGDIELARVDLPSKSTTEAPVETVPPAPHSEALPETPPPLAAEPADAAAIAPETPEAPEPAAPAPARRNGMALDDYQHGVRIKARLREEFGVGETAFHFGRKRAAKRKDLSDRERVLLGYVFALMSKTKKSEAECKLILKRIVEETA